MRTILFLSAVLIFGLVSCNNASSNRGVVINGVRWATSNVEMPGTFARNPESAGGLFTWEEAQNACPQGWRLPTADELRSLNGAAGGEWTAINGVMDTPLVPHLIKFFFLQRVHAAVPLMHLALWASLVSTGVALFQLSGTPTAGPVLSLRTWASVAGVVACAIGRRQADSQSAVSQNKMNY